MWGKRVSELINREIILNETLYERQEELKKLNEKVDFSRKEFERSQINLETQQRELKAKNEEIDHLENRIKKLLEVTLSLILVGTLHVFHYRQEV